MFLIQYCTSWASSLLERQPKKALSLPVNQPNQLQPVPAMQPEVFSFPVNNVVDVRIVTPVSGENVAIQNGEIKMTVTVANIQAGLTSLNTIATQIETVANLIPSAFLPVKVQEALTVLKAFQTIAPAVLADVQDAVTKIETAYASLTPAVGS